MVLYPSLLLHFSGELAGSLNHFVHVRVSLHHTFLLWIQQQITEFWAGFSNACFAKTFLTVQGKHVQNGNCFRTTVSALLLGKGQLPSNKCYVHPG